MKNKLWLVFILITVITGIRRCGKSTLMEIYRDWLISQGVSSDRIVFINFENDFHEVSTNISNFGENAAADT